jgi:hypothetical protein
MFFCEGKVMCTQGQSVERGQDIEEHRFPLGSSLDSTQITLGAVRQLKRIRDHSINLIKTENIRRVWIEEVQLVKVFHLEETFWNNRECDAG